MALRMARARSARERIASGQLRRRVAGLVAIVLASGRPRHGRGLRAPSSGGEEGAAGTPGGRRLADSLDAGGAGGGGGAPRSVAGGGAGADQPLAGAGGALVAARPCRAGRRARGTPARARGTAGRSSGGALDPASGSLDAGAAGSGSDRSRRAAPSLRSGSPWAASPSAAAGSAGRAGRTPRSERPDCGAPEVLPCFWTSSSLVCACSASFLALSRNPIRRQ